MPQFTNYYNSQNGAGQMGPPNQGNQNGPPQMNSQGYMDMRGSAPPPPPWEQQGWKSYSQEPITPIVGRWVSSFDDIKPQDVPMNGSMCFFPQKDYSCVYAMIWANDGQIKTYRLVPEKEQPPAQQTPDSFSIKEILNGFLSSTNDRMDALERRISDILEPFADMKAQQSKPRKTTTKESDAT